MNETLITVIIPCCNYADYVQRAIESVFNQAYKTLDVLVINDGSTDNSDDVIKTLKKKYAFRYIKQANKGIVATRNVGINKALGEFIIQLDADDTLPPNYVEELVEFSKKTKADIYYTKAVNLDTQEAIIKPPEFNLNALKVRNYIHASAMIRTDTIKKYEYDEFLTHKGLEDWDINLAMCLDGARGVYVGTTHLNYRQHASVVSRGQRSRRTLVGAEAIKYILDKNIKNHPKEMSDLRWMNDNIGRLIDANVILANSEKEAHDKHEQELHRVELLESELSEIKNRKLVKYYDRLHRVIRHPITTTKLIVKKIFRRDK